MTRVLIALAIATTLLASANANVVVPDARGLTPSTFISGPGGFGCRELKDAIHIMTMALTDKSAAVSYFNDREAAGLCKQFNNRDAVALEDVYAPPALAAISGMDKWFCTRRLVDAYCYWLPQAGISVPAQSSAASEPQTTENSKGITVEVLGIQQHPGDPCALDSFTGRVVKRDFGDDALTLTGITLEDPDGSRFFINVEIPSDMSRALRGRVVQGLQLLSKVGRQVTGRIYRCGAAGRFNVLDEIK